MDITIQYNNYNVLSPEMKRARLLIVLALAVYFIMTLITGAFNLEILSALGWNHQMYLNICSFGFILSKVILLAGYIQFYIIGKKTNSSAYRMAGIILSIGILLDIVLWYVRLSFDYDNYVLVKFISSFIPMLIFVLGISMLWLASYESERKFINCIVSVSLFIIGYNLLSEHIFFRDLSNPLVFSRTVFHEGTTTYTQFPIMNCIFPIIQIYLWWKFCSNAIQDPSHTNSDVVQGLLSRPFIAFIICSAVLYFAIGSLSNLILS